MDHVHYMDLRGRSRDLKINTGRRVGERRTIKIIVIAHVGPYNGHDHMILDNIKLTIEGFCRESLWRS